MARKLIRIYESAAQAAKVAQLLRDDGYEDVFQFKGVTGKGAAAAAERKALVADLMNAQIWKSHAEAYADRLTKGGSLVVVHAPFGSALDATNIMDRNAPVEVGYPEGQPHVDCAWDDAAPLSSVLRLPVLSATKLPSENVSGIPSLTKGTAFLSDLLGIPLLKRGAAQRTSSWGLPMLSRSSAAPSTSFGLSTLSQNPTPLSSLFNIPVLTKRR
jgi:hypothetical protein